MPIIPVKYAEMHNAIFVGRKSLGPKLDPMKLTGLELKYDMEQKELLVTWNNETMHFLNPLGYVPGQIPVRPVAELGKPHAAPVKPFTAQVHGPQAHVHAGPGAGKTGIASK